MMIQKMAIGMAMGLWVLSGVGFSQMVMFEETFEAGPATRMEKIRRYPMTPEVLSYDSTYPRAFPPPSGVYAVRAQDQDRKFYGLGSVVAGPEIDITNPRWHRVLVEAKLWVPPPAATLNQKNVAVIAIDDSGDVEQYYRFGYANRTLYFHFFNGSEFVESLFDPIMGERLTVPGWHTFGIGFEEPGKMWCLVDGAPTSFSPILKTPLTKFRMGVLGWDQFEATPILADDFRVVVLPEGTAAASGQTAASEPTASADSTASTAPIQWFEDPLEAMRSAQPDQKFLVFFYLSDHPLTKKLVDETLRNPGTQSTIRKFIPVVIEGQKNQDVANRFRVYQYPSLKVIDVQGRVYWEYRGLISPEELNAALRPF